MKRTCRGRSRVRATKPGSSGSSSGIITTFSFTGLKIEAQRRLHAGQGRRQGAAPGQPPVALGSSESRLMLTRSRPCALSASANRGSRTPLVVREMSRIRA